MSVRVEGVAILLWAANVADPARCATPFMHAAAAAALDVTVEIYFSAQSIQLLKPGVAAALYSDRARRTTVAAHMEQAHEHGAKFFACASALENAELRRHDLMTALVDGLAGATSFQVRVADPAWRTLVF